MREDKEYIPSANLPAVISMEKGIVAEPDRESSPVYGLEDIEMLKRAVMKTVHYTKGENNGRTMRSRFGESSDSWYNLITREDPDDWEERHKNTKSFDVEPQDYAPLQLNVFKAWRINMLRHGASMIAAAEQSEDPGRDSDHMRKVVAAIESSPEPTTLDELRDIYRKEWRVNKESPIHYQGSLDGSTSPLFVHVISKRMDHKEWPGNTMRFYLNPKIEDISRIAEELAMRAMNSELPLNMKFKDYSTLGTETPNVDAFNRLDKMLVYIPNGYEDEYVDLIYDLQDDHPEWFEDSILPPMCEELTEGVGVMDEATPEQSAIYSERFPREDGASANQLRAVMLQDAWTDIVKSLIEKYPDQKDKDGETFRQVLRNNLSICLYFINTFDRMSVIDAMIAADFDASKLDDKSMHSIQTTRRGADVQELIDHAYNNASQQTLGSIFSVLKSESILPFVQKKVAKHARNWLIDPDNLSANL
ncbi:hypothetical protein HQ524_04060 [Candidatus Uhrbacteria bacterium]|nr:hypothetical protein [Candidatus Uhrbacteria bacterium]